MFVDYRLCCLGLFAFASIFPGCGPRKADDASEVTSTQENETVVEPEADASSDTSKSVSSSSQQSYEVTEAELLDARLPREEVAEGWVRLFDGHTFFGWQISGDANFRVQDNAVVVDDGEKGLICTSTTWGDFELVLQFNADADTNSGVFVRTPLSPENPAEDCYEINIAPDDNPFPTGSIVQRQKVDAEAAGEQKPEQWREMKIIAEGQTVAVELDGKLVCQYEDPAKLQAHRIGLQHNSGRVAFRDIKIRPLGFKPMIDAELTQWKRYPEMEGEFTVNDDGHLHVDGGKTQLETLETYGDFFLRSDYRIDQPDMNSGIFFRCIPGDEMMGYECQINNDFKDQSRLSPVDCGTGGIFRRQDARVVAGENGTWATVVLQAYQNHIAAWVNGVQVSDWEDTRPPDENPRRGRRDQAGTIIIQGHDPTTDVLYRDMQISTVK